MRMMIFWLCLLLILTACAGPGQATREQPGLPTTPVQPLARPTAVSPAGSGVLVTLQAGSQDQYEIHLVDPSTGQDVPGYPPIGAAPFPRSADGKRLAAVESHGQSCEPMAGGTACRPSADVIHFVDLPAWRDVKTPLPATGWTGPLSFSPDSARAALSYEEPHASTLILFDAEKGTIITRRTLAFRPTLMAYSQDGTTLALYGQPLGANPGIAKPDSPRVLLLDATTLDTRWEKPLTDILSGFWCLENCRMSHEAQVFANWTPGVVFAHDGHKLYIVHADAERLTTVDFATRSLRTVEIQEAQSWVERLLAGTAEVAEAKGSASGAYKSAALSPDGTQLYLAGHTFTATPDGQGNWQSTEEALDLQVIDVASGQIIARSDSEAETVTISPDGAYLFLDGRGQYTRWMEARDARSLALLKRLDEGWQIVATRRMNGQPILLASHLRQPPTRLAMLDPQTFAVVHAWSVGSYASWVSTP